MTRMTQSQKKKTATSDVLAYPIIATLLKDLKVHQKLGAEEAPSSLPSGQVAYLQNNFVMYVMLEMPPAPGAVGNAIRIHTDLHMFFSKLVAISNDDRTTGHFFQNHWCCGK